MPGRRTTTTIAILVLLGCTLVSEADEPAFPEDRGTFSFVWENDFLGGTDRNYSNGIRLAWLSDSRATDEISGYMANTLLGVGDDAQVRRGFAFGHAFFTPRDLEFAEPLPDQHPYAGWLYGEYATVIEQQDLVDRFAVKVGLVGPNAGGEWLQNGIHSLIDDEPAQGWKNQVGNELGVALTYDRKFRRLASLGDTELGFDMTPNVGMTLGNVHSNVRAGLVLRFGQDLRTDFGPPRIRPSLAGAGYFTPRDQASWYLFAGIEGRAVVHNIFLDGSLFSDRGPELTAKKWVVDTQAGLAIQIGDYQYALTYVSRTKEFEEQREPHRFGALSISSKF